ncbi:MAG TPA: sulfate ABC transporter permease subunit [Nocardioides sp.]|uniref:sulfate ABC transporter permease n=1 Tax=uncultured Nocardioides sp. TaxID=198441 RepID=UPI00260C5CCB|nr:sulfate ABC transporter permease subunit [uncultured Nocardioides sp.]HRD64041.1 sulfate ABC transporter permease subunit [Nocardioides sp.]HRI97874.1 sulfate ABC transporter permease subunit [Nocardioides sp.]HRK47554.1 sulfate ABC transporter permease subunit [Nocardioides sp.]
MASTQSNVVGAGSPALKWLLRIVVVGYLFMLIAWPSLYVVRRAFEGGVSAFLDVLSDPGVTHALQLSVKIAVVATLINLLFGVGMSLLLVRYEFPGKRALSALIDLPLAVSPIVVGLALILVYNGRYGWFGPTLEDNGIQIVFSFPGMVMATTFVALPLIIREVVPVLEDMGDEQEQAANSLGANGWQTFWRVTLPGIKWAIVYGVVLTFARSLGEFGAVKVVAGNVSGETTTAPVLVQQKYQNFEQQTAYAVAFILVAFAVVSLIIVALLRPKDHKPARATATAAIQEKI